MKQLAIIGSTASGKTSLSIGLAKELDAYILSLDSLSIYKEIDIASAKPTMDERSSIIHFGVDCIYPDESFDVTTYIRLYKDVYQKAKSDNKNLIIVGGTSFYLKMLMDGISTLPKMSKKSLNLTKEYLKDIEKSYRMLQKLDPDYMDQIASSDKYRIEKALNIYFESGMMPTEYFRKNPPMATIDTGIPVYQIGIERAELRERISQRTELMLKSGLIDEVAYLEKRYSRAPNCMRSIGIKETLDYLDGIYSRDELTERITTNTARLAKRQSTFNNSQLNNKFTGTIDKIEKRILSI